eukprot:1157983-Pelagomonas_calceolata.AAC.3
MNRGGLRPKKLCLKKLLTKLLGGTSQIRPATWQGFTFLPSDRSHLHVTDELVNASSFIDLHN